MLLVPGDSTGSFNGMGLLEGFSRGRPGSSRSNREAPALPAPAAMFKSTKLSKGQSTQRTNYRTVDDISSRA
jgi:hypothetical protein